ARSLGLTVDDSTPWSVVVHGAAGAPAQLSVAPGVASVLIAGGPRPLPAGTAQPLRGGQWRSAYQAASPSAPTSGAQPIVATIQFSGWNPAELAGYAQDRGMMAPIHGQ